MPPTSSVKDGVDKLISTRVAAKRLGRRPRQLRRMIAEGRIAAVQDRGRLYIYESTIQRYLGNLPPAAKGSEQCPSIPTPRPPRKSTPPS